MIQSTLTQSNLYLWIKALAFVVLAFALMDIPIYQHTSMVDRHIPMNS